jgi:hypothetical protein
MNRRRARLPAPVTSTSTSYVAHYNFCRKHGTLGMTPAPNAKVMDRWWTFEELVELIDRA